jgi:UDP-N-acetylmuramate--alanine ligase
MVDRRPLDLTGIERIHLVGVGGAGMSALAKLLHQSGLKVSGSDFRDGIELRALADLGVDTWAGHQPDRISSAQLVVASSAVPDSDPELVGAVRRAIPVWRRPQLLAAITAGIATVGPSGTHGKTTTTALLTVAARALGLDPSFVVGGEMIDLGTNAHKGTDPLLILEIDEAFGTFEHLTLAGLIVTSIEGEHLDYFGSVEAMEATYAAVASRVNGPVVCSVDDPGSSRLRRQLGAVGYGLGPEADWRITNLTEESGAVAFDLLGGGCSTPVRVPRPGRHIAANAAGAVALLAELGHDPEPAARGLGGFGGVKRRFELRGTVAGVTLIDDYAHHPTEVAATIAAARARSGRLWAIFQPHLFSRTLMLHDEFGRALAGADRVVVTDIYAAREVPVPGVSGELVADAATRAGADTVYIPHRSQIAPAVAPQLEANDVVLTMGAGDITLVPAELAALLAPRLRGDR